MTTKEFSDAFDTLLASYNHKADFGDLASYADVTLDEYEKSVFLTQAQDNVIKNYFTRLANSLAEGFDDSIRRLADFSSLITVHTCSPSTDTENTNWSKGSIMFNGTLNNIVGNGESYSGYELVVRFGQDTAGAEYQPFTSTIVNGILKLTANVGSLEAPATWFSTNSASLNGQGIAFLTADSTADNYLGIMTNTSIIGSGEFTINSFPMGKASAYDERGVIYRLPPKMLLMLNERVKTTNGKFFVVVPISYKEYDRQMSRAYAQPLKKQCWRLFEGEYGNDTNHVINAEIIPKEGILVSAYIVRYIRRPRPIILTDLQLTVSQEPLEIDGETTVSECELSPILHMDILEEAVRLALNSKGIETRDLKAAREAQRRSS